MRCVRSTVLRWIVYWIDAGFLHFCGRRGSSLRRPCVSELRTMPPERELRFNAVRRLSRVKLRLPESDPHALSATSSSTHARRTPRRTF